MHRLLLLWGLCLLPFLTGCIPVPVDSEYPHKLDRSTLDSLIGKDKRIILHTLHRPIDAFASETSSYFVYGAHGTEYQVYLLVWVPIAGDAVPGGKLFCVLLEFDEENIFRRYQIERHSESWSDKEVYDCAFSFFTKEELDTFTSSFEEIEAFEREEKERAHVLLLENNNELIQKAEQGDPNAQYKVFILMKGENIEPAAAWRLLCKAANQGYKEAQIEIGYWHKESSWERAQSDRIAWLQNAGIDADNRVAYMWYTLAAKGDLDRLRIINNMFSGELTEEETAKAKDMARNWKPGQCPSPYQKFD